MSSIKGAATPLGGIRLFFGIASFAWGFWVRNSSHISESDPGIQWVPTSNKPPPLKIAVHAKANSYYEFLETESKVLLPIRNGLN